MKNIRTLCLGLLLLALSATAQALTVLKSFDSSFINATGFYPKAALIGGPSNTLFGTAYGGGPSGYGVVFKVQTDGTGLTVLWNFSGGSDGANPVAGLLLSGTTLYGTTFSRGASNLGTVFALNTDGSGFTNLHDFTGSSDGANPTAGLVLSSNTLYGTSFQGGHSGLGTVFALNTNGSGFTNLRSFTGGVDCGNPYAGLLLSGSTLYGTTTGSNALIADFGSVFKINTDGSGFAVLKTFLGSVDFANPFGGLVISGSTLYGTTESGNNGEGYGTVFSLNTNGGAFTTLHSFDFTDGDGPYGTLVLLNGSLYGTTFGGGSDNWGSIFRVSTSGSGFTTLYSFTGGNDGGDPYAGLVLSGGTLYGAASDVYTPSGNGYGGLFSIAASGSDFTSLFTFTATEGSIPYGGLILSGGTLYGTTSQGGASNQGTVFSVNTSNGSCAYLHNFAGEPSDGSLPYGTLILGRDGNFYGTTYSGGTDNDGTIFQMTTNGVLATLVSFDGTDGSNPYGALTLGSGGSFFGTTYSGGRNEEGTAFKLTTNGAFSLLIPFDNTDGEYPYAGLTLGSNDDFYGTTSQGGSGGYGTVFRMTPSGGLTTLVSFGYTNGASPQADLTQDNYGNFYGTTYSGGSNGYGTVFRMTTNGVLTTLVSFAYTNGESPYGSLVLGNDGNFYGTTYYGGNDGYGTVFQVTTNGTLATLVSFASINGAYPQAGLTLDSDGNFYGTTTGGGSGGEGTVFRIQPLAASILGQLQPSSQTVPEGVNVTINANVFGALPLICQWTFNGINLPGETNNSLTLTNVILSQSGLYALLVTNNLGVSLSGNARVTVVPAIVTTLPATEITGSGAELNGSVSIGSEATLVWFEWGTNTSYGNITGSTELQNNDESNYVSANLTGLPGNIYHYRIDASNDLGTFHGNDQPFTVGLAPQITSLPSVNSSNGVTLSALVNPGGLDTSVYFRWGTYSGLLTNSTPATDAGAGATSVTISSFVTHLAQAASFYYQAVASNHLGTTYGAISSFLTPPFVTVSNENWQSVAVSADGTVMVAVVNLLNGSTYGPIFVSTNAGTSWSQATNAPHYGWQTVACSADGSNIVTASGGGFGSLSGPIYTSRDLGQTWLANNAPHISWEAVASSADGTKLVAAGLDAIYTSTNAGADWTKATNAPSLPWECIAMSADGSKLVAGAFSSPATNIYTSTNFGVNWITNVVIASSGSPRGWISIASSADGSRLLAATGGDASFGKLFLSTNSGTTWSETATNIFLNGTLPWIWVASSADGSRLVALANEVEVGSLDNGLWTSTNYGTTWVSASSGDLTWTSAAMSADGGTLLATVGWPTTASGIYVAQTAVAPALNLTASENGPIVSWTIPSLNFTLQQSVDLSSWTDVTNPPVVDVTNLQHQVALPPPSANTFYRLIH